MKNKCILLILLAFPGTPKHLYAGSTELVAMVSKFKCEKLKTQAERSKDTERQILSALSDFACAENATALAELIAKTSYPQYLEKDLLHYAEELLEKKFQKDNAYKSIQLQLSLKRIQGIELKNSNRKEVKGIIQDLIEKAQSLGNVDIKKQAELMAWSYFPSTNPSPSAPDYVFVGKDLEKDFQFTKALEAYQNFLKQPELPVNLRLELWRESIRLIRKISSKEKQVEEQKRMIDWIGQNPNLIENWEKWYFEAVLKMSSFYWNMGEKQKATQTLEMLLAANKVPERYKLEALFNLAQINKDENSEAAINYFNQMKTFKNAAAEFNFGGYLQAGEFFYFRGNFQEALDFFQLAENLGTQLSRERTKFWQAVTNIQLKEYSKAKEMLEELGKKDEMGLYGLLARTLVKANTATSTNSVSVPLINEIPIPQGLELLKQLGFRNSLRDFLYEKHGLGVLGDKELIILLQQHEYFPESIAHYFSLDESRRVKLAAENPELAYPIPHEGFIRKEVQKTKIPTALVYAIMRQESLFDTNALSPADAMGLLQLIPATGKHMAQRKKMKFQQSDLFEPEKNLRLGIEYLNFLYRMFDGNFINMVAAYNAGPSNVKRWHKNGAGKFKAPFEAIEFAESIPFNETRDYVVKVMRNYANYCRLYKFNDCTQDLQAIYRLENINLK